jgi:hypothetical protein
MLIRLLPTLRSVAVDAERRIEADNRRTPTFAACKLRQRWGQNIAGFLGGALQFLDFWRHAVGVEVFDTDGIRGITEPKKNFTQRDLFGCRDADLIFQFFEVCHGSSLNGC